MEPGAQRGEHRYLTEGNERRIMKLKWKYFVIEPRSKEKHDPFAKAARRAMRAYAESIALTDLEFASEIRTWVDAEEKKEREL